MNSRIRKFISYYRPYHKLFFADMSCAIAVAAIALAFPLCVRYITKDVLEGGLPNALPQIYWVGAGMLALVGVQSACEYFYDYRGHAMGAMMERDLRGELFDHYQKLSFGFYDDHRPGQLMSRIVSDLTAMAELYHHAPEDLVIYLVKFTGAFVILMNTDARLTLVVFSFLPFMTIFALRFGKRMNLAFQRNLKVIGDVNAQVEENLSGIRVVQSFANEDLERRKFAKENDRYLDGRASIYRGESQFYVGIGAMTHLITVAVVVFGGAGILRAQLDLADLITFLLYVGYLIEPIPKLANVVRLYQEGIAGFGRFMEMIETRPDIQDAPDAVDLDPVRGEVEFRGVGFQYREDQGPVLQDINLRAAAGDYIAIVGYSGVGKTTLCSLIPRFYEASEGNILLDGVDIRKIRLRSLRRSIGVVQQDVYLFAGTVQDNIRYGNPDADLQQVVAAAKRANAHEFILALPDGYDTDIGHRGVKLSGGQKQRISIARAFLKDPRVLILDEATSALDRESERVVQNSLQELAKDRTTFVIAHRLSTIRNARRIVVLSECGIEEQGTHDELLALGGTYAQLYDIQ